MIPKINRPLEKIHNLLNPLDKAKSKPASELNFSLLLVCFMGCDLYLRKFKQKEMKEDFNSNVREKYKYNELFISEKFYE